MKRRLLTLAIAGTLSLQASADTNFGGNYSIINAEDSTPTAITLRGGYEINPLFSVEGRVAKGFSKDSIDGMEAINGKADVDYMYGVYGKLNTTPDKVLNLYGVLGYSYAEFDLRSDLGSISDDEGGFSYGLGLDVMFEDNASINFEWTRLFDTDELEAKTFNVGVTFKF
ncbi:porin family protein [Pleionea sediminis]|uniref:porin family protein n=1 Tax=Pleionea sediminis TaxID=2569479 RepID=UPI001185D2E6|nr:porin family protein [Pleionea sediminis]